MTIITDMGKKTIITDMGKKTSIKIYLFICSFVLNCKGGWNKMGGCAKLATI